jgi:hypothetical protein
MIKYNKFAELYLQDFTKKPQQFKKELGISDIEFQQYNRIMTEIYEIIRDNKHKQILKKTTKLPTVKGDDNYSQFVKDYFNLDKSIHESLIEHGYDETDRYKLINQIFDDYQIKRHKKKGLFRPLTKKELEELETRLISQETTTDKKVFLEIIDEEIQAVNLNMDYFKQQNHRLRDDIHKQSSYRENLVKQRIEKQKLEVLNRIQKKMKNL